MQIQTAVRHHDTPVRLSGVHTPTAPDAGEHVEQQELSSLPVGVQMVQSPCGQFGSFLQN